MPATYYFLRVSCNFLYLVQCNIKMALKNEGDADFVLLDAKKTGVIFTLYWWCPDMSKSRYYWQPQNFFKTSFFYWLHSFAYDTVIMHHKRLQASIKNIENIKLFLRGQQTAKSLHLCSTCYFFRQKLIVNVCNFVIMQPLFFQFCYISVYTKIFSESLTSTFQFHFDCVAKAEMS